MEGVRTEDMEGVRTNSKDKREERQQRGSEDRQ